MTGPGVVRSMSLFPFYEREKEERCAHFVTLLAAFVPTVVASGITSSAQKRRILRMCERTRGRAHRSTNKCFNLQLSADNKKPLGFSPDATVVIAACINTFLIVARQKTYGLGRREKPSVPS